MEVSGPRKVKAWPFIVAVLALAAGYLLGKNTVKIEEKTTLEYVELPAVQVSVSPTEIAFTVPDVPKYIWRYDTIIHVQIVDTSAILADWILQREYGDSLVEDKTGSISYTALVQYNRLQNISLNYIPKQREITTIKTVKDAFIPFVMLGYGSNRYASVSGGFFGKKYGFSVEYGNDFAGKNYLAGKLGWRF